MSKYKFLDACDLKGLINPWSIVVEMYNNGASCNEISEIFADKHQINVTSKHLSDYIKKKGLLRSYSERKINAIKRGRMVYTKKLKHEKCKSGNPSSKTRLTVLQRDNFKCTLCGNSPQTGSTLEIHHKNGANNDLKNLQTLCFLCHRGIHSLKKED